MGVKYKIYSAGLGFESYVSPIGDVTIKGSKEKEEFFYREELSTIKLIKEDYLELIEFENEFNDFNIDVLCDEKIIFKGSFNMQVASICKDNCFIELEIKEISIYDCLKTRAIDRNIISTPSLSKITTEYTPGSGGNLNIIGHNEYLLLSPLDQATFGFLADAGGLLFPVAWGRNIFIEECINGTVVPVGGTLLDDDCSGTGFFTYSTQYTGTVFPAVSGNCLSPVTLTPVANTVNPCPDIRTIVGTTTFEIIIGNPVTFNVWASVSLGIGASSISLDRGYLLNDVLSYLSTETECGITCFASDFFNDPINYVTGNVNKLNNLIITEMGDITRGNSSSPATKLIVNLFDLYETLKEMFNLIYKVDENGCFRIEHISKSSEDIIKISDIGNVIKDPCCYKVDRSKIPERESWEWNEANGSDFIGKDIEYRDSNGNFYSISDNTIKDHDLNDVSTDIDFLYLSYPDVGNLDGYVITANDFDGINYSVFNEIGLISNIILGNGHLSQSNLHNAYWRFDRYLLSGELNGNFTIFESVKPYKDNDSVIIKVCCDNYNLRQFDFKSIETDCGIGIIEDYIYDIRTKSLELNIKFK